MTKTKPLRALPNAFFLVPVTCVKSQAHKQYEQPALLKGMNSTGVQLLFKP